MFLRGGECRRRQLPGHEMFLVAEIPLWLVLCSLPSQRHAANFYAPSLLCSCCALPFRVKSTAVRSGRDESHVILYYHSCERGLTLHKSCSAFDTHGEQMYCTSLQGGRIAHASSSSITWKEPQVHKICSAFDTSSKSRFS